MPVFARSLTLPVEYVRLVARADRLLISRREQPSIPNTAKTSGAWNPAGEECGLTRDFSDV